MSNGTETEDKVDRIAKHLLLDANGVVVDEPEQATGIRYIDVKSGVTVDRYPENAAATLMYALFGMKTLATNEASRIRQADKTASGQDQVDGINARFDMVRDGKWVDRTRVGGPRYDHDVLAEAVAKVALDGGLVNQGNVDAFKSTVRGKLTADGDGSFQKRMVDTAGVSEAYKRLAGKKQGAVTDLADLVS